MFPKFKQWRSWKILSKYTVAGTWATFASILLAILFWLNPIQEKTAHEKIIEVQNPTEISVEKALFQMWLGDSEESLTAIFKNGSTVPADAFTAKLVKGEDEFKFTPSNVINFDSIKNMRIKTGTSIEIPLAKRSEVEIALELAPQHEIVGIGLEPEPPPQLISKLKKKYAPKGMLVSMKSKALGLFYGYNSVFGSKHKKALGLYFYIDTTSQH